MDREKTSITTRVTAAIVAICAACAGASGYLIHITTRAGEGRTLSPNLALLAIGVTGVLTGMIAILLIRKWLAPAQRLRDTLQKIADGDFDVRAAINSADEFESIGHGVDRLLSQRNVTLQVENENERLNDSIITLLKTVADMANRDLTVRAKVRADVTGPIADALNLMAAETAHVLHGVTEVATNVAETSNLIKTQSDHIVMLARQERENLEECAQDLGIAAEAQNHIARLAQSCSDAGEKALQAARIARVTTQSNVAGFQSLRDTLEDTERRVRVLLERCQEIAGAINLINHISERTHILALNASMHAAAVGEAGRGFSAVANEVQRLAENTREMTIQIGGVIQSVQTDTSETMKSLQTLAAHVRTSSELVDRSGRDMQITENATTNLVELVQKIAAAAATQNQISATIRGRTNTIIENVSRTGAYLLGQAEHTDNLVEQAMALVESVGVFKLPDHSEDPSASPH